MTRRAVGTMVVLVLGFAAPAGAATIPVTTTTDTIAVDGACALREAVLAVNAPPGTGDCVRADANANTISLGAGTHVLTRAGAGENAASTGDVDILAGTVSLTITGAGAGTTTIDASGLGDRLFDVATGAPAVTFQQLTLTGGRAPSGIPGQPGTAQAGTAGEHAGAIQSLAGLTLTDVVVTDNRAGAGGAGGSGGTPSGIAQPGGAGGPGGNAGALQVSGALTLTRVTFSFNQAGVGGAGGSGTLGSTGGSAGGSGGLGGYGGAIVASGPTTVQASRFEGNRAGDGGAGGEGSYGGGSTSGGGGGAGGAGGPGGALRATGDVTLGASTFTANRAGTGGAGGAGGSPGFEASPGAGGAGGTGAGGGAILSQSGGVLLLNATFAGNQAGGGGAGGRGGHGADGSSPGSGAAGGAGGNGGNGGALRRQLTGSAYLTHGTAVANRAGAAGAGGAGGSGGSGSGGSTGSTGANGAAGLPGAGGAVSEQSSSNAYVTEVTNSILASNTPLNCAGVSINNGGRNLAFGDASCAGFTIADPLLGPLQDNGGAVDTMAPLAGSPAIDQVPALGAACPATDARGVTRPVPAGGTCDIGAVEISSPSCQPVSAAATAGQPRVITLTCSDAAGAPFAYAITSPPAHGALSGLDSAAGLVTYTADAGYTGPDAFGFQGTTADGTASASVTLTVTAPPPGPGPGPAPAPGSGPGTGGTTSAPVLSSLRIAPGRFRAARRGASALPAATATSGRVTFRLDRAATVRFTVARRLAGRRSGSRCVKPTRSNRRAKACTRLVAVTGSFSRSARAGTNAFRFTGRIGGRRLVAGRYVLRAVPRASGLTGRTVSVAFRIVR